MRQRIYRRARSSRARRCGRGETPEWQATSGRRAHLLHVGVVTAQAPGREVTALYETHALSLIRLALRHARPTRPAAEDVVQEAFLGLVPAAGLVCRDTASAPGYLRASVLNGCRMVLRSSARRDDRVARIAPANCPGNPRRRPRSCQRGITGICSRGIQAAAAPAARGAGPPLLHRPERGRRPPGRWASGAARSSPRTSRALAALGQRMQEYFMNVPADQVRAPRPAAPPP